MEHETEIGFRHGQGLLRTWDWYGILPDNVWDSDGFGALQTEPVLATFGAGAVRFWRIDAGGFRSVN
jgi:hypothetical protein